MFRFRFILSLAALTLAAGTTASLWGFDLARSRTSASAGLNADGAPVLRVQFRALLKSDGDLPDLRRTRVVVGWREVGGVDPTPFRILIPAGCFMGPDSLYVEDGVACGVLAALGDRRLPAQDFTARARRARDGSVVVDLEGIFGGQPPDDSVPPNPVAPALGALGGSAVRIVIGDQVGSRRRGASRRSGAFSRSRSSDVRGRRSTSRGQRGGACAGDRG